MYNSIRILILLFTLLISKVGKGFAQEPHLYHYTSSSGLPSNTCYYLFQDRDNFIWIATFAGVARYDGQKFEKFTMDNGLADNQILQITQDKLGRIWFLSLNGKMSYFYKGKIYNSSNDKLVKKLSINGMVTSFLEDKKGRIWLGTNTNLLSMWDGNKLHSYVSKDLYAQFSNAYVHEDSAGVIRAYSHQAVLVLKNGNFEIEDKKDLPISYKVFNSQPGGKILYLKKDGLYQKSGALTLLKQKIDPKYLENDPGYFYADEQSIWLSTSNGVVVFGPKNTKTKYLQGTSVNQVTKDKDGNYWFTTGNGIYMLPVPLERMYIVNTANGLSNNSVMSIGKDNKNRFWLGLDNGTIDILNADKSFASSLKLDSKYIQNYKVKQLKFNQKKDILYFAFDRGLGKLEQIDNLKPKVTFYKEKTNAVLSIKNFDLNNKNEIALALSSGVIMTPENELSFLIKDIQKTTNYIENRAYKVYYDNQDRLWYSNIYGLGGYWNNKLQDLRAMNTLLSERMNDIIQISTGEIVLATDGHGVLILKDGKIKKILTTKNGLGSNIVYKLYYHNKMLWAITNSGINRINIKSRAYDIRNFDYASELLISGINDLFIDDQNAYFATNAGLVYFVNSSEKIVLNPAEVHFKSIKIDNSPISIEKNTFFIPENYKSLYIEFSVVDFSNRNIQYRYRLKNKNSWIATNSTSLEFSALEPGDYNLQISARYPGEKWGPSTELKFKIELKFYQSTWFWVVIALLGAFIVFRIIVMVNRQQRNKEKLQLMMKNKILTLEQQALQALMNPHFIFNVMNSIQHYINTQEKVAANKMLTGFARLIRKNLDICAKSYITIEEELEYLNLYLSLEKIRFGEKFNYTITVDEEIDTSEILIPSMLLQPFIENAIWHGLMPKPSMGEVNIIMRLKLDTLIIEIIDNGIGINASKALKNEGHISKGMELTKERIRIINAIEKNNIQLSVKDRALGGTLVELLIPLKNQ